VHRKTSKLGQSRPDADPQKSKTSEWYVQSFLFFKADHLAFFTYKLMAVKVDRMMTAYKRNNIRASVPSR
jgi:hypothetical protein